MKSFFVIKGNPHIWFDQQGKEIPNINKAMGSIAENPVGFESHIDYLNQIPIIKLWYHVVICKDPNEVRELAAQQN